MTSDQTRAARVLWAGDPTDKQMEAEALTLDQCSQTGPAASASPGNSLAMHILRPRPRTNQASNLRGGAPPPGLDEPSRWFQSG